MGSQKFTFVQALRGIAALWVVLFHANAGNHVPTLYSALSPPVARFIFDAGYLGVAIFFTLSGFVIAHSLSGKILKLEDWGQFMVRRSIRLDPAFWVSIVIVVALGAISAMVKGEAFSLPTFGNLAAHIAYLQVILGLPEISPVYWTLTYEIQFYAVFAAAMMFPRYMWVLLPMALLSAMGVFDDFVPGLFVNLWASFFVGVLAKYATGDLRWLVGLAIIGAPLAWSGGFGFTNVITALALWAAVRSGWAEYGLGWRWLQLLGAISYSLYLVHNPVSGAAGFVTHRVLGEGMISDIATLVAIIVSSVVAAFALWMMVERPTHRFSRRVGSVEAPNQVEMSVQS